MDKSQLKEQKVKERRLISDIKGVKVYGVFYENDTN